mgnify:CR=1 FL=1
MFTQDLFNKGIALANLQNFVDRSWVDAVYDLRGVSVPP